MMMPMHYAIARALCRVTPESPKKDVDWLLVADNFVTAVAGEVLLVPPEEYDRTRTSLRDATVKIRELTLALRAASLKGTGT